MIDNLPSSLSFQPCQRAILAFLSRAKDKNDRILLWNGRLRWKSEMEAEPKQQKAQSHRGRTAHTIIIDDPVGPSLDLPLDSSCKPSTIPPCQSTHQSAFPNPNP